MNSIEELRAKVLAEIQRLTPIETNPSKTVYRTVHTSSVQLELERQQGWVQRKYPKYAHYFASGSDIKPTEIAPTLVEVEKEWQSDLFRLARLTWSLPYTRGYGRRLRFLLIDESNQKLIGILGLQSPPLDFPARDRIFNYPEGRKVEIVNQTMDIYTLGAVPPYGRLLGGKLVALAAAADEVRKAYQRKYTGSVTRIDERKLPAHLIALTTTSAFGRSSLYNRVNYKGRLVAESLGYTEGYGSFHLAPLYTLICEFLQNQGVSTKGGFGVGPRVVWQTYTRAFGRLGLPRGLLKHGLKREVFLFRLINNLNEYIEGQSETPIYYEHSFTDLATWWRERWLLARADRVDGWHAWDNKEIGHMLLIKGTKDDNDA